MRTTITTTSFTLAILAADFAAAATTPEPNPVEPSGASVSVRRSSGDSVAVRDLHRDLEIHLRRWRENEELLGKRRRRELRTARYYLLRENPSFRLHENDPLAFEEATDFVKSALWKLTWERVKHHFAVDDSLGDDSREDSRLDDRQLVISPRFGLSRDPYLGANVRLAGDDGDLWPRFALGLRHRLESGEESIFVQYKNGDRLVRLERVFDDPDYGDQVILSAHWQW